MDVRDIRDTLLSIDEEASLTFGQPSRKFDVVIAGGSAFMLHDITKRPVTHDIDILSMDRRLAEIISHYPEVNGAMSAFLDCIPYNYEDRLIELPLVTNAIRYYTPSLEDLAVMKLYAWRPNDISDLTSREFLDRIDWDILHHLIFDPEEARASSPSDRLYGELIAAYQKLRKEHGPQ